MIMSFEILWKVWIKNQYSVTYTFAINASYSNCQNFVKNYFPGNPGKKNFNHERTGNKQFFEVGLIIHKTAHIKVSED